MRFHRVQPGESPTMVARRHGVSLDALVKANPFKPATIVAGRRTFKDITNREIINVPVARQAGVGDSASDAINALIVAGGPCVQLNVALVCSIQAMLGVTVDGKWGSTTSGAARLRVANAPAACYPRPTWWAPVGQSSCPVIAASAPAATTSTQVLAPAAVLALGSINPCDKANVLIVCAAQKALGVTVDGKYGTATAGAARKLFPSAPPACDPRPAWWAPVGQSNCVAPTTATTTYTAPVPAPTVAPSTATAPVVPSAVLALAAINPCLQQNVAAVYAAQKVLGVAQDGKYGTATASAARRILPSAPAACDPRPSWWAPVGQNNPINGTMIPPTLPTVSPTVPTATIPMPTTAPSTATLPLPTAPATTTATTTPADEDDETTVTTTETITAPEKKGISTGALVAGAIGAAALVGIVAIAATSGKSTTTRYRTKRKSKRKPGRRKASRKTTRRKKSAKRRR